MLSVECSTSLFSKLGASKVAKRELLAVVELS